MILGISTLTFQTWKVRIFYDAMRINYTSSVSHGYKSLCAFLRDDDSLLHKDAFHNGQNKYFQNFNDLF